MTSYTCNVCNKRYQRKIFYEKHIYLCELQHGNRRTDSRKEVYDIPTHSELFSIVQDLMHMHQNQESQICTLRKEVKELKQFIHHSGGSFHQYTTNRKTIVEYLTHEVKINQDYTEWKQSIELVTDIEFFFEGTLGETITKNICSYDLHDLPIRCDKQTKQPRFYMFHKDDDKYTWQILSDDALYKVFFQIYQKIIKQFNEWNIQNNNTKASMEKYRDFYERQMMKLFGTSNRSQEKVFQEVKLNLSSHCVIIPKV